MEAESLGISHCSFRMYHYADPEEPLRRSEVLPIVGYMRWRLNQFDYIEHRTFPVSSFHYIGTHAISGLHRTKSVICYYLPPIPANATLFDTGHGHFHLPLPSANPTGIS